MEFDLSLFIIQILLRYSTLLMVNFSISMMNSLALWGFVAWMVEIRMGSKNTTATPLSVCIKFG